MGLKLGWEQMGRELGIWGWGEYPPPISTFKRPSLVRGQSRGQQEKWTVCGEGHNGARREGRGGGLRPSWQGKRAPPLSSSWSSD
jgi:hypothetical protein